MSGSEIVLVFFTVIYAVTILYLLRASKMKDDKPSTEDVQESITGVPTTDLLNEKLPERLWVVREKSFDLMEVDYYLVFPDGRVFPRLKGVSFQLKEISSFRSEYKGLFTEKGTVVEEAKSYRSDSVVKFITYFRATDGCHCFVDEYDAKQFMREKLEREFDRTLAQYDEKLKQLGE